MYTCPLFQVDAFTDTPLEGNPCAVLLDADGFDESLMLRIAAEMNLSETAFVSKSDKADFRVRFFTPAEEVPLAGHPTIATAHTLIETGHIKLQSPTTTVTFELNIGVITVEIDNDGERYFEIRMNQPSPKFLRVYEPVEILPLFSLEPKDLLSGTIIQTVSTGLPQVMIAIKDLKTLNKAKFRIEPYVEFRKSADFFSPHLFCLEGATQKGDTFARHFFPPPDVIEDPFTGSGNGAMGAYLWHYGLINQPKFKAEQGHNLGRPGIATIEVFGKPDQIETVKLGGRAVTILKGELCCKIPLL